MTFRVKDKYLLVNGLSGAVRLVPKEIAQKFFDGETTPGLEPFFTHLTPEEEYETARSLCEFIMKNTVKCADGTMVVTYDCNLRCPYCMEIWVKRPETMRVVMDEHKVTKAYEVLERLTSDCTRRNPLTLTGGEPLLKKNREIVEYILKKGKDLGYSFAIFTNGVELDHFLSSLSAVDVTYLKITIDGPRHLHDRRRIFKKGEGTFDTITKNIEEARTLQIPVLVNINTDAEILSCIDELAHFFREKGWVDDPAIRFSLGYVCDKRISPEAFDEETRMYEAVMEVTKRPGLDFFEALPSTKLVPLFDKSARFWPSFWNCNAASNRYVFDPFGDVYACRGMLGWREERIGEYIPELSLNENYKKWRSRTIFAMDKCAECDVALVCAGGCGYAALLNEGDLFTPVCMNTKRAIAHYVEYLYERSVSPK